MTEMPPYLAAKDEKNSGGDSDSSSDVDDSDLPLCFDQPRHLEPIKGAERVEHSWRVKEKYKTHCVALVLCLNVGVDPPDVVKTQPCARLECWLDPQSMSQSKALESIGHALQSQYERWQPRARYKQSLDPTSEEVKKLCCSLRRNAKDERVLFHYNGHGVPRPTTQGEIWVFNRSYTQYIPLSMYDLQTWMGAPSLYVYDCSNAGVIVDNFRQFAEQHEREYEAAAAAGGAAAPVSYRNCIQLAACAAGQALPMNPELPADLFTACLTTPVKMAMKWFVLRTRTRIAPPDVHDLIDKIPGQVTDRRTMLGELNWIFTAITDTIAWSSLPAELFQQLFRADLLTASLCRNFLLADRIMRSYNCTPVSRPALPSLAAHPLWAAWEHTLDAALAQLPALLAERPPEYRHAPFFRDQLTAFQVWLELGSPWRAPPAQLPMVLQVLLSTLHRVRALQLLCRFLALGARAVRAVLAVGIFPYMLKLLQASAPNLRASMVYIWSRIIAVDPSCQADLVNAKGHKYFLAVLQDPAVDAEHRTLAAYVLAGIVDGYPAGQEAALQGSMISVCLEQLDDGSAPLAQWACIALGRLWRGFDAARWAGVRDLAHEKLFPLMRHPRPEVRAACAFALGAFVAAGGARTEHANALDQQVGVQLAACLAPDAAALVRQEILAALQWVVLIFEQTFVAVCIQERGRRSDRDGAGRGGRVDPGLDARVARLDTSAFHSRCALPPAAVLFHPYEQHAAVASKDSFGVWDWGSAAKLGGGAWRRDWGRITALAYLNAHEHALLAAASHAGHVAVFRPAAAEPALVAAWRGLDVRRAPDYRPPPAQPLFGLAQLVSEQFGANEDAAGDYSPAPPGTLLRWSARRRSLALAGAAPVVRLWDAAAELHAGDIATQCAAPATALWRGAELACGFADGSVRAWDERAPGAPLFALHAHAAPVLAAVRRADLHVLVSAAADGEVRLYDTRTLRATCVLRAPGPLAAADVHRRAPLLAVGSLNQCIAVYDLKGAHLNTIKFHEGFMGARIGPVSCLAFHPLRLALGVGSKDSSVSVYVAEARR